CRKTLRELSRIRVKTSAKQVRKQGRISAKRVSRPDRKPKKPLRTRRIRSTKPPNNLPGTTAFPRDALARVIIETLSPEVDSGNEPAKTALGEVFCVTAVAFADGHDPLSGDLLSFYRRGIE